MIEKEIEEEITKENLFSTLKGNKLKIALEVLASLLPEGKVSRDLITIVCDNLFSK